MAETLLLALETSSRAGSVALARLDADGLLHRLDERAMQAERRSTAELIPAISDLLRASGHGPRDVGVAAFSAGPGSFTGLRVAATIVRTFVSAVGCKAIAVPTAEVVAQAAFAAAPGAMKIAAVLEGREALVYAQMFQRAGNALIADAPARTLTVEALLAQAGRAAVFSGPGAWKQRAALEAAGAQVTDPQSAAPTAAAVALAAAQLLAAGRTCAPHEIVPFYLRPPECELVYEKRREAAKARRSK